MTESPNQTLVESGGCTQVAISRPGRHLPQRGVM